jgi:hypothetical protein
MNHASAPQHNTHARVPQSIPNAHVARYVQLHEFNFLGFALEYDTLAPGYQGTHHPLPNFTLVGVPRLTKVVR